MKKTYCPKCEHGYNPVKNKFGCPNCIRKQREFEKSLKKLKRSERK